MKGESNLTNKRPRKDFLPQLVAAPPVHYRVPVGSSVCDSYGLGHLYVATTSS